VRCEHSSGAQYLKISLGSWAFSFGPWAADPIPFETIVRHLAKAGYDGIDVCGFPPHITPEKYSTKQSRADLVRFLADEKMGVSGYAGDFYVSPAAAGNETEYLDLMKRNIEICADLGSPSLRVDTVAAPGSIEGKEYDRGFHRVARLWSESAALAEAAGIKLVWEFEPGFAFNKPGEIVRMYQEVRHPNFSVLFDTAHAYMCSVVGARQTVPKEVLAGGVAEFLDRLQGRIGAVHIVDSDGTLVSDETSTHYPFGAGLIDFEKLVPKLLQVPDIDWWTIDLSFRPDSWELVGPSRHFVADLLQRHSPKG
jgi:sugar phosphate isomerase/epimerase